MAYLESLAPASCSWRLLKNHLLRTDKLIPKVTPKGQTWDHKHFESQMDEWVSIFRL